MVYLQETRFKYYDNVRQKKYEDIKVHTKESDAYFDRIKEGDFPVPSYSTIPSDEEIKEHGLFVIGKRLDSEKSE